MQTITIDREKLRGAIVHGTLVKVAEKLGYHHSQLSNKLRGKYKMTLEDLNDICKAINREPLDFITTKKNFLEGIDGNR